MGLRHIAGDIEASGNIKSATSGFTVEHVATGHYTVHFNPPFSKIVSVVGTRVSFNDASTLDNLVIINFGNDSCEFHTGNSNGKSTDSFFSFIALGIEPD
jgi:hypothetical protein